MPGTYAHLSFTHRSTITSLHKRNSLSRPKILQRSAWWTTLGTGPAIGTSLLQQIRERHTKHWSPKWKNLRAKKVVRVELPNFQEKPSELSQEEMKSRMKEKGLLPPRHWMERPFFIACTGGVFEPYVPPEGDGKSSALSRTGAKQRFEFLEKKSKSMLAIRKVRSYEEDFDANLFAEQAQEIYRQAHRILAEPNNKYAIRDYVTERAYPEMMYNIKFKTIHWQFLKSLEPPRVVHARCTDVVNKENIFGQITVRFHTQQMLAIYDRFGRLMYGSEILAKDVLEYVVFEKHLSNEYGVWRLHDKLIPDWMPAKQPSPITYRIEDTPVPALTTAADEDATTAPTLLDTSAVDGTTTPTKAIAS